VSKDEYAPLHSGNDSNLVTTLGDRHNATLRGALRQFLLGGFDETKLRLDR
jgi:hypothetical protein